MKKASLTAIREFLDKSGFEEENPEIMAELDAELNKGAEEKAARAKAYEGIHDLIIGALSDTPATCADVFEEIKDELTAKNMTRYNVQHALNNLWQDEIVKIPGKPNTYRRA